jgi:hypothetical protein
MMHRRDFLKTAAGGLVLLGGACVSGCSKASGWPDAMAEIKWDRDTCARCKMVISDRRYAAELRGGPKDEALKFDDIGCAVIWARNLAWAEDPKTRFWVASSVGQAQDGGPLWLDARQARYLAGKSSPMGYGFGAVVASGADAVDFATMRNRVFAEGR